MVSPKSNLVTSIRKGITYRNIGNSKVAAPKSQHELMKAGTLGLSVGLVGSSTDQKFSSSLQSLLLS